MNNSEINIEISKSSKFKLLLNTITQVVFICIFCVIVTLPLIQQKTSLFSYIKLNELRQKASFPSLTWESFRSGIFMKEYEKYYSDNFGFRDVLIRANNQLNFSLFQKSLNDDVIIGKDGFLFLKAELNDFQKTSLSPDEINNMVTYLEGVQKYVEKRGKKFLFFAAPNKSTIYPEYMPKFYQKNTVGKKSNYDLLYEELEKRKTVEFLDLRPTLQKHKKDYLVYWKEDSHWSASGSYFVSLEVLQKLSGMTGKKITLPRVDLKKINIYDTEGQSDLKRVMGIEKPKLYNPPVATFPKPREKLFNLLWNHDSFTERIKLLINPYASHIVYTSANKGITLYGTVRTYLKDDVEIVVYEKVERGLPYLSQVQRFPEN